MRLIASSLLAGVIALGSVAPAFADDHGRGHGRGRGHGGHDHDRGGWDRDWDRGDWGRDGWGRDWGRDHHGYRGGWYGRDNDHHYWRRGDYFSYRPNHSNFIVVNDYYRYRLPPPRYGEYYYRDDRTGEILLVAAATGLILWALSN